MKKGDVIRIVTPSAGGYYDPFERDPQAVLTDVLDMYADIETTAQQFGVVIDRATMRVDAAATSKLRAAHKKTKKNGSQPAEARRLRKGKSSAQVETITQ